MIRWIGLLFIIFSIAGFGCLVRDKQSDTENKFHRIISRKVFAPEKLPYTNANLILSGTTFPVTLEQKLEPGKMTFFLKAHKVILEEESYIFDDSGFRLAAGAGLRCDPPIPILRFPMTIGDSWNWGGDLVIGEVRHKATAKLKSSKESLNLPGGPYECVMTEAEALMESGGSKPAIRKLKFWFAEGKGLIKREFGMSSTRQPADVR